MDLSCKNYIHLSYSNLALMHYAYKTFNICIIRYLTGFFLKNFFEKVVSVQQSTEQRITYLMKRIDVLQLYAIQQIMRYTIGGYSCISIRSYQYADMDHLENF